MEKSSDNAADLVIDGFGGTGAICEVLGVNKSTVSMWRARGAIPGRWHLLLLKIARESKKPPLSEDDLVSLLSTTSRTAA